MNAPRPGWRVLVPTRCTASRARARGNSGVAMIVVLTVIAILTTTTLDFAYTTRVQLHMAANQRDGLRAYYLARSGFSIARLILHYQNQVDQMLKRFPQYAVMFGSVQLWKLIPLESGFLNGVATSGMQALDSAAGLADEDLGAAGDGAGAAPGGLGQTGGLGESGSRFGEINRLSDTAELHSDGTVEGLGEFSGNFFVEFDNENRKIPLWLLRTPGSRRLIVLEQLWALLAPSQYNFLFEQRDPDGQYTTREELLGALVDWYDPNDQTYSFQAKQDIPGSEDAYYQNLEDRYVTKNAPMDTDAEMQLVRGVGDDFMRIFGDNITVYPGDPNETIYAGDAKPDLIIATLCALVPEPHRVTERLFFGCDDPSGELSRRFWEEFQKWQEQNIMSQLGAMAMMGGGPSLSFETINAYLQENGIALPKPIGSDLNQVLGSRITTFKVKSHGQVGDSRRTITAVVYNQVPGGQLWYYRED